MHTTIVPFTHTHLDEASRLLAGRHERDRQREPGLPILTEDEARQAIEKLWRQPRASGVVALRDGHMQGYLLAITLIDDLWGRCASFPNAAHALRQNEDAEVYRDLYAALSPTYLALGCFLHIVQIPAHDQAALEAWFSLSFGKEQAYALGEGIESDIQARSVDPEITISRATIDDLDAVLSVADLVGKAVSHSPTYGIFLPENYDEWPDDYAPLLENEQTPIFLARRGKKVVGYALWMPGKRGENLLVPENSLHLSMAATVEEERGKGIGQALLAYGIRWGKDAGYTSFDTDWRVANLWASRFWPRQGFRPAVYRLSRRLDPRVIWAHGDLKMQRELLS